MYYITMNPTPVPALQEQEPILKCDCGNKKCACETKESCKCESVENATVLPDATQLQTADGKIIDIEHGTFARDQIKH
jgi:hypothetical protein